VTSRPSDEQLFAEHQAGKPGRFNEIVRRYAPELYRFLVRFTGDPVAAEDILQETFLQVYQSADRFDPDRPLRPWLFTIAANKARDWLRAQKRRPEVSLDAVINEQVDEPVRFVEIFGDNRASPPEQVDAAEQRQRVEQIVQAMSPKLREVLVLGYFHRMPYRQIAEVLRVPVGTVKSRLHAAVRQFARLWAERFGPAEPPSEPSGNRRGGSSAPERGG